MNFITQLGEYLFYYKYLWAPADFALLQTFLQNLTQVFVQGITGAAVLTGWDVSVASGLTANVAGGIAAGDEGQPLVSVATQQVTVSPPGSMQRWDLLVARQTVTPANYVPDPTTPATQDPLNNLYGVQLVIIQGTASNTPSYPGKVDGDCIICGFQLPSGLSNLQQSNIDYSPREVPPQFRHTIIQALQDMTMDPSHDTVEAVGGAVGIQIGLPPAFTVVGQDFTVSKIDAATGVVTLAASGGDLISGSSQVLLDSQWDSVTVRSVGQAWRTL
jgi:hypothetical protein